MENSSRNVLGTRVDVTDYGRAAAQVCDWAGAGDSRYVCAANVHMVMEGHDSPPFQEIVNGADLVTADGMPLVWAQRLLGVSDARRVYGPDLMLAICAAAEARGLPVGLYGGTPEALAALRLELTHKYPRLRIVLSTSPPFRPLDPAESIMLRRDVESSGARILFVGLGCPKQEQWMGTERGLLPAVMIGVGAAFDFLSHRKWQAPPLMQRLGMEWLFRLTTEPRRLWRRYLRHNPRFMVLLTRELAHHALHRRARGARRAEP